jgi:hypothetical protein
MLRSPEIVIKHALKMYCESAHIHVADEEMGIETGNFVC